VPLKAAERFLSKLGELEEAGRATPVILDEHHSYLYVQYSNLYLLAVTRANVNAAAVLVFLHKLVEIFKHYFTEVQKGAARGAERARARPAPAQHPPRARRAAELRHSCFVAGGGVPAGQLCDRLRAAG
jgi:hypothetical protein